jgi:hypothetical protein
MGAPKASTRTNAVPHRRIRTVESGRKIRNKQGGVRPQAIETGAFDGTRTNCSARQESANQENVTNTGESGTLVW